ncbi:MAG: serine/threonine protein kinase [Deltaproteobacteria bacterium]|nr:serine/threonine protein kinase [Deltaproteobacteria bacterium]
MFGPYTLLHRIATGGMGEIHLARLERGSSFQKLVVIKRIIPTFANEREFVRLFENEARIAAQLTHQNIVPIYDFGRVDETTFIAMEYVHGEDARSILTRSLDRGGPLPLAHAIKIGAACLRGLAYAHRRTDPAGKPLGIVHRDVSPQNILVSFEGEVKLTDFGLAKAAAGQAESQTGGLKGKYSYMSPEQVTGKPIGPASDIFSLAATLFEIATGKKLFGLEEGLHSVLEKISRAAIPNIGAENPGLPAGFVDILNRALAKTPDDRFASASEMELALTALAREEGLDTPTHDLAEFVRSLFHERAQVSREVFEKTVVAGKGLADHTMSMAAPAEAPRANSKPAPAAAPAAEHTVSNAGRGPQRFGRHAVALAVLLGAVAASGIATLLWPDAPALREDFNAKAQRSKDAEPETSSLGVSAPLRQNSAPAPDAATAPDSGRAPTIAPASATLIVTTIPPGARLWLDDTRVPGGTPIRHGALRTGRTIRIRIAKTGFRAITERLTLTAGENTIERRLVPQELRLSFSGTPNRAAVAGRTLEPRRPVLLPVREHHIEVSGASNITLRLRIVPVESRRAFRVSAATRPWTELRLDDIPTDNPLVDRQLGYGTHTFHFSNEKIALTITLLQ